MKRLLLSLLASCAFSFAAHAENWPNWRGPTHNGASTETNLPDTLDPAKAVWKTDLPGPGGGTPIVWEDKVFVTSSDAENFLHALCINRTDGKILWQKKVALGDFVMHKKNRAAPSPITDGKSVYFLFGTGDLLAYDFNGKELWKRKVQEDLSKGIQWGYGASALLFKNKLYVPVLQRDRPATKNSPPVSEPMPSYLLCIDAATGKDLWKHVRPSDAKDESLESYSTPYPFEHNGRTELIVTGGDCATGHDPETGKELWRFGSWNAAKINHWRLVVSAVASEDTIIFSAPKRQPLFAVKAGGNGQVPEAWKFTEFPPDVCTPAYANGVFYVVDGDKKQLSALDPKTGEKKWGGPLGGMPVFNSSPTVADGKVYLINEGGEAVVASATEPKVLSRTQLAEGGITAASISVAHGHVFVRTPQHLFCFKK